MFYMDMRTHGKDFERYFNRAKDQHGVRFIRSRVHTIDPVPGRKIWRLITLTEDGIIKGEQFDMIVLSVGFETAESAKELAKRLDIVSTTTTSAKAPRFSPVSSSKPGIFVCGSFQAPKDIPQSVMEASAAAAAAGGFLAPARGSYGQ